ncbi:MAG: hypothetical protein MJH10_01605 [Epibacterium sp.]|nr:hypothetical protein [Epibacterium sp.]NQX72254.1 hypothetical protein [Epibacterium sp.]
MKSAYTSSDRVDVRGADVSVVALGIHANAHTAKSVAPRAAIRERSVCAKVGGRAKALIRACLAKRSLFLEKDGMVLTVTNTGDKSALDRQMAFHTQGWRHGSCGAYVRPAQNDFLVNRGRGSSLNTNNIEEKRRGGQRNGCPGANRRMRASHFANVGLRLHMDRTCTKVPAALNMERSTRRSRTNCEGGQAMLAEGTDGDTFFSLRQAQSSADVSYIHPDADQFHAVLASDSEKAKHAANIKPCGGKSLT